MKWIIFISFFNWNCSEPTTLKSKVSCVDSIKVINRTSLGTLKFHVLTIKELQLINNIELAADTIKIPNDADRFDAWGNPGEKNSFGSYDVLFYCGDKVVTEIDIYFIIFKGILLTKGATIYKNDDFYIAVLNGMQKYLQNGDHE